jgi:hypothetical protein
VERCPSRDEDVPRGMRKTVLVAHKPSGIRVDQA